MFKIWEFFSKGRLKSRISDDETVFQRKYRSFKALLAANNKALELIADLEHHFYQDKPFTLDHIVSRTEALIAEVFTVVEDLNALANAKYAELFDIAEQIGVRVLGDLVRKSKVEKTSLVFPLEQLSQENAAYVGGKAANLGEVSNRVNLPVPPGFAITAYATLYFLEKSRLLPWIQEQLKDLDVNQTELLMQASQKIQARIMSAQLPADLSTALMEAAADLNAKLGGQMRLAVRSSATSEDGEASFAGQHTTVLNVDSTNLIGAYKEVVASTFSPRAIFYRRRRGYTDQDVIMSVACIAMVDAWISGVMYTVDPNDPSRPVMLISALWGLAAYAVEGSAAMDFFLLDKAGGQVIQQDVVVQTEQLRVKPEGGVHQIPVPEPLQAQPCLQPDQIAQLFDYGRRLEHHYRQPLDIEWAIDASNKLFILQARPLQSAQRPSDQGQSGSTAAEPLPDHTVVLRGGATACEGTASGLAFVMPSDHMLHHVPEGAIVVVRETSPRYVPLMGRIQALITDVGSVTGHMASVAREFRIPTLVGTGHATTTLAHGQEITLDATHGWVYAGRVEEILETQCAINPMKDSPIYRAVRTALQRIAPLNLIDPKKENFSPKGCTTIHDIIRFCHEMAMQEMFRISDNVDYERSLAVPLKITLPLNIYMIDLGGGLRAPLENKVAQPEDLTCEPLKAMLEGMSHKDVNWYQDVGVQWSGLVSVLAQSMIRDPMMEGRMGGPNYALISQHYMNFNSRLGYHFATIDTHCGPLVNDNYITFSFKGGAADIGRRARRAILIADILKGLDFKVEQKVDMVRGQVKKYDEAQTAHRLNMLGRLLGSIRLLDMVLADDHQVQWYSEQFFKGNYSFQQREPTA
ncbi:MAG: PEP-utilizing enzyme [Desulfobacteraceae bacterium]|nr:PEP-utilizing enzyme [Desulfobacteraceae bacterium]